MQTKITWIPPSGLGTVNAVAVQTPVGTSNSVNFAYDGPIITSINPALASTSGERARPEGSGFESRF